MMLITKPMTMKEKTKWAKSLFIIGVIILFISTIDQLEGSILIVVGSILLTILTYLSQNQHLKIFVASSIMIVIGVIFLFIFRF